MKKTDVLDIGNFRTIIEPHLNREKGFGSIGKVFDELLQWIYEEPTGFCSENRAILHKWLNGERPVNLKVINTVFEDREMSLQEFKKGFQTLIDSHTFVFTGNLCRELLEKMECDPFLEEETSAIAEKDDTDIMAAAIFNALINNYVKYHVKLEIEMENQLEEMITLCQKKDQRFQSPHALYLLLNTDNSLLYRVLEQIHKGFGRQCRQKVEAYVNAGYGKSYAPFKKDELQFLFYAKKAAFREKKPVAGEAHVIEGLFLSDANTIHSLNKKIEDYNGSLMKTLCEVIKEDGSRTDTIF